MIVNGHKPNSNRSTTAWVPPGYSLDAAWVVLGTAWVPPGYRLGPLGTAWVQPGYRLGTAWVPRGYAWVPLGYRLGAAAVYRLAHQTPSPDRPAKYKQVTSSGKTAMEAASKNTKQAH